MKALIFVAVLLALASCQDNDSTPNILIGTWSLNYTNLTSSTPCCLPGGTMTITNSGDDSVTMTATSWDGGMCGNRSSSFEEIIDGINGAYSWNQLTNGSFGLILGNPDQESSVIIAIMEFIDGFDVLALNVNENLNCSSMYLKTSIGNILAMAGVGLIAVVTALLI